MTAEELEKRNIAAMGEALGKQYTALYNKIATLHLYWKEYLELFGTDQKRIDRMNQSAPGFFRILQTELFQTNMLHIARLTDPPQSMGKDNLTLRNLPDLVGDKNLKNKLIGLLALAEQKTSYCRDWCNRRFAHYDLELALDEIEREAARVYRGRYADRRVHRISDRSATRTLRSPTLQ
jgi:hypothetical protein